MTLNGQQHEQLSDALREAFRSPQRFTEFVKFRFNKNLYDITIADDLKELAFDLIDESRPCVLEKQNPDELDYALLRVSGNPGKISVGERDSPQRGWINLPTKPYEFSLNTPLFILQHPKGKPLKLAIDAIIDVNDIIVKYETNTEPGSSGSPCFDINWNLVALHHSGYTNYNAGTSFNAICPLKEKRGLLAGLLDDKQM
ncbi:MAG: serine protease [Cyanomargarita calcarea GSE-NOS-MK-12-04C]|jgi:hypothetical protein|uniref:Serine protease n=1 Tax=Cyanomargarita calcarea GSE-NOS-MK-12-04C TaxID=2839659 RepID=A0A951QQ23_9CYAN|nr:serine protease [Cyanomargarita calcarea GSE-NOS-MK-12-04C]